MVFRCFALLLCVDGLNVHEFCRIANYFGCSFANNSLDLFCATAKVRAMKTKDAMNLAGGRKQLAEMLGVASITTYRWGEDLSQKHEDRLRVLKPVWFRKPKAPAP